MATPFFLDPENQDRLLAAVQKARTKIIPWDVLKECLPVQNQESDKLTLADRGRVPLREPETVLLPFGWRVAISCEEQPAGILLHLSMSSPAKRKVPRPEAMVMVIEACGFTPDDIAREWLEEFEPGHFATNILIMLEQRKEGHA